MCVSDCVYVYVCVWCLTRLTERCVGRCVCVCVWGVTFAPAPVLMHIASVAELCVCVCVCVCGVCSVVCVCVCLVCVCSVCVCILSVYCVCVCRYGRVSNHVPVPQAEKATAGTERDRPTKRTSPVAHS